jgi:hypothetical protein
MIDWTITAGNVLTIITLAIGALAAFFSLRGRLDLTQSKGPRGLRYCQAGAG